MENKKDIAVKEVTPSIFEGTNIKGDDAFMVVTLAFLREPFLSSDVKRLCLYNAVNQLSALGYSDEDVAIFKDKINAVISNLMPINDFMG